MKFRKGDKVKIKGSIWAELGALCPEFGVVGDSRGKCISVDFDDDVPGMCFFENELEIVNGIDRAIERLK